MSAGGDIRAALRDRVPLVAIAERHVRGLHKRGSEYWGLCPFHGERTPSFHIVPARRFFKCFGCGEHGDVIDFYMRVNGVEFADAVAALTSRAGLDDPIAAARARRRAAENEKRQEERNRRERAWRQKQAVEIWRDTLPAGDSPVPGYLAYRGVDVRLFGGVPRDLRYMPSLEHWRIYWEGEGSARTKRRVQSFAPAMVAAIRSAAGEVIAVHCTWLKADGSAKADLAPAKKIFGPWYGGAIRLTDPDYCGGHAIAFGEGIESSLSYWAFLIMRGLVAPGPLPGLAIWAAGTLGNLCGAGQGRGNWRAKHDPRYRPGRPATYRLPPWRPDLARPGLVLPAWCNRVVIARENDSKDPAAYEAQLRRAVLRFDAGGLAVLMADPSPHGDFNDLVRSAQLRAVA